MTDNPTQPSKLYSQKAISFATYFGGPLAAGILARQNFLHLGKEKEGMYALIIGILLTFLIFAAIFSIPESIADKIPNALIPAIYTGLIYLVLEKLQGKELKAHKDNNGEFYSNWKAAGVGAYCLAILFVGLFGSIYLSQESFDAKKYDSDLALFSGNEEKALELFKTIDSVSPQRSVEFIDQIGIPAWKSNLEILNQMDQIEGLVAPLLKQNTIFRNYCNLKIESYQLIKKALSENSPAYAAEIQDLNQRIEKELEKLKE